jgi:ABC-type multidrug transport system fused ATPase/permease subunit
VKHCLSTSLENPVLPCHGTRFLIGIQIGTDSRVFRYAVLCYSHFSGLWWLSCGTGLYLDKFVYKVDECCELYFLATDGKKRYAHTRGKKKDRGFYGDGTVVLFENVEFRYRQQSARKVLNNITKDIKTRVYIASIRPYICGKSTIFLVLERFHDLTSGRVAFSRDDISRIPPTL